MSPPPGARPLSLSDPECLDPAVAGGKAARLARARAAGLPVLPGIVVDAAESIAALGAGRAANASGGVHGARLAVMEADVERLAGLPASVARLVSGHGSGQSGPLVVRSSSPLEGSTRWSGAFTSFLDVRPEDVLTAVRGVWASAAGDDVRDRTGDEDIDPEAAGVAVLVQPQVEPEFSGTAEVDDAGCVTVAVVAGPPAPLVGGWEPGHIARCLPAGTGGDAGHDAGTDMGTDAGTDAGTDKVDGTVEGAAAVSLAGRRLLRDVADLTRAVRRELGDDLVEWAAVGGALVLLQAKSRAVPHTGGRDHTAVRTSERTFLHDHGQGGLTRGALPAGSADVARLALVYAGPSGERLVLPWLLAGAPPYAADYAAATEEQAQEQTGRPSQGTARPAESAWDAWEEAVRLARDLTAAAWPGTADPEAEAASALSALRGVRAGEALRRSRRLPAEERARADRAMALFGRVALHLAGTGALTRFEHLWALPPDEVCDLLAGRSVRDPARVVQERRRAALRWEPFAYTAVMGEGTAVSGVPASPGTGAGPVVFVAGRPDRTPLPPRAVVVAPRPLPHLAPLLWGASALVTFGGGTAAHLIEVARSLAVPAVVGCTAETLLGPDRPALAAVDGDRGIVAVHPAAKG